MIEQVVAKSVTAMDVWLEIFRQTSRKIENFVARVDLTKRLEDITRSIDVTSVRIGRPVCMDCP